MPTKTYTSSSTVESISHEGTTMTVTFKKTGKYEYSDVPLSLYNDAEKAESIGSWIYANLVKGNYKCKKV